MCHISLHCASTVGYLGLLQMFPVTNNTPYLHWPSHPFCSHLPLHSCLGPYCDQKLPISELSSPDSPLCDSGFLSSNSHLLLLKAHRFFWSSPFFFPVNWLLPNSHGPFFLPPSSLLLWARHCTKCRGYKVVVWNPSTCWLLAHCLSAKAPSVIQTFHCHFHFASQITFLNLHNFSATVLQNIAHDCPFHFPGLHLPPQPAIAAFHPQHSSESYPGLQTTKYNECFPEFALFGLQTTFDTNCVTLGESLNLFELQFPHQWKRDNSAFLIELLSDSIK